MANDIVVRSDKNGGKVHLSADRVYDLNEDKTQDAINEEIKSEIGIVITGNRPSQAVTAGQYVIVKNSTITGITDGLYTAKNALSTSSDVSASDLNSEITNGGLNDLKNSLNTEHFTVTKTSNVSSGSMFGSKCGTVGIIYIDVTMNTGDTGWIKIADSSVASAEPAYSVAATTTGEARMLFIYGTEIKILKPTSGTNYMGELVMPL